MKKLLLLPAFFLLAACTPAEISAVNTLGSGPITIDEFSDLQCPACGSISPELVRFVESNPGVAKMRYYHYPLTQHQHAFIAAEASECAADQGKFWEFIDNVFANQSKLSEEYLYALSESLSLDQTTFKECLDGNKHRAKVLSHLREGRTRGVAATPTIYVNGEMVKWPGYEAFESYIKGLK